MYIVKWLSQYLTFIFSYSYNFKNFFLFKEKFLDLFSKHLSDISYSIVNCYPLISSYCTLYLSSYTSCNWNSVTFDYFYLISHYPHWTFATISVSSFSMSVFFFFLRWLHIWVRSCSISHSLFDLFPIA